MSHDNRLVYTTATGRVNTKTPADKPPATDGIVRIWKESKGRGGKAVSVIKGLGLDADALKILAKELKQRCGVGGSVQQWDILIQGDQRATLRTELEKRGYTVKLAGG